MAVNTILDFKNLEILRLDGKEGQTESPCQILSKSAKPRQRYGNFFIFQAGGRRRLGFVKFQICNSWAAPEGRNASPCQIWSKSVKTRRRYGEFSIFQDGGRRHLGFLNFQTFTVGRLKRVELHWLTRVELHRRAKFG